MASSADIQRIGAFIQIGIGIIGKSLDVIENMQEGEFTDEQRAQIDKEIQALKEKYEKL